MQVSLEVSANGTMTWIHFLPVILVLHPFFHSTDFPYVDPKSTFETLTSSRPTISRGGDG